MIVVLAGIAGTTAETASAGDAPASAAAAASAPASASTDGSDVALPTVTVTADARKVDLQKAALAVSAITADTLEQSNIQDPMGLNGEVPGLQINSSSGSEVMVYIRGIGSQTPENFFSQSGVSFHMDGIYISNPVSLNMGFLDVDHVEVQRGPQGTVFGQASTGGTINVVNKKPELGQFDGDVEAGIGNYNWANGKAAVNVPIGERAAVRAVVSQLSHDGYSRSNSIAGGYDLDDADELNGRLSGLWQLSDDFTLEASAQHYRNRANGAAMKALDDPNSDPWTVSQDFPGKFKQDMTIDTLIATWQLPFATARSTSSYQDMRVIQSFDQDRSDYENFGGYDTVVTWSTWATTYTQELTLTSPEQQPLSWVAGAFLLKSSSKQYALEYAGTDMDDATPLLPQDTDPANMPANTSYEDLSHVDRKSWAGFAQATWHITASNRLTFGTRYNGDDYDGWSSHYYATRTTIKDNRDTWTGKLALEHDLSAQNMVYLSASRGYKPGGVNPYAAGAMVVSTRYKPESINAIELGSKNRFLQGALTLNGAAFYYDYQDMQFIQEDPIPYMNGIGNIPTAHIWGAEAEMRWQATQRLQLAANLTTLDGEFPDHFDALDRRLADAAGAAAIADGSAPYEYSEQWYEARGSAATDVKGNTPADLPKLAGGLSATWMQPIGSFGVLSSRVEALYRSDYQARVFNTAGADQVPGYTQWNLNFALDPNAAPWRTWLTITNITNRAGVAGRFVDPYGSGVVSNHYIAPRQAIVNFSYHF